jgi:hypothetical protein
MPFRLPNDQQRSVVIGKTGSGKTVAGIWQLSERSWPFMPWIIYDFKRDQLIARIPGIQEISLTDIPTQPGLYVVRPLPGQEDELELQLQRIWQTGNIGVYIDEGYMFQNSRWFIAILTQGRSKRIPVITLTQRPSWITRFVFSEADFIQVFWLNDARDRKTVESFVPYNLNERLPPYWSIWYDVGEDRVTTLRPVPREDRIIARFAERMPAPPPADAPDEGEAEPERERRRFILL